MSINWSNVFTWGRTAGLSLAGAAAAVTKLPDMGVPVDPRILTGAYAIVGAGAALAAASHAALEVQNPATYPQVPLVTPGPGPSETVKYADGSSATGPGPLPTKSPDGSPQVKP